MSTAPLIHNTNIVKILLNQKLKNGNIVVDATMGNGYDTLFLCQQALPQGTVYAFDIQKKALEKTSNLLKKHGFNAQLDDRIRLIKDTHENFDLYIEGSVDVFMYNLGYLPGSDHSIVTDPISTVRSLKLALKMLKEGGIISLIVYYGHLGGNAEKKALLNYLKTLSSKEFKIFQGTTPFNENFPPIIYVIEKTRRKNQSTT